MFQVDQFLVLLYLETVWPLLASDDSITQFESTGFAHHATLTCSKQTSLIMLTVDQSELKMEHAGLFLVHWLTSMCIR
jgi:hypothetical protein